MDKRLAGALLFAADLLGTLALYSRLPAQVPVHWNLHGEADRMGSPWEMLALGPGVILLFFILMLIIDRVDPLHRKAREPDAPPAEEGAFATLMLSLMALACVAHLLLVAWLAGVISLSPRVGQLFGPALLLIIGNFLPRVRPNYFGGIRTPWTLASAKVWRRTHRASGVILFSGGLISAALALAGSGVMGPVFIAVLVGGLLVPALLSYVWWREEVHGTPPR